MIRTTKKRQRARRRWRRNNGVIVRTALRSAHQLIEAFRPITDALTPEQRAALLECGRLRSTP